MKKAEAAFHKMPQLFIFKKTKNIINQQMKL